MRRFYAPQITAEMRQFELGPEETRHLRDVLRLQSGATVAVFDGRGNEFTARLTSISRKNSTLEVVGPTSPPAPESPLDLRLAVALLKGEKFDFVVQKAVELGVRKLIPMITVRSDVKLHDASRKTERWQKIAIEAAKQCGRARVMDVSQPENFKNIVTKEPDVVIFAERGGSTTLNDFSTPRSVTAMTGPEGGWDDAELELATAHEVPVITLGGRILRAETAAVVVTTLLQHRFGDLK